MSEPTRYAAFRGPSAGLIALMVSCGSAWAATPPDIMFYGRVNSTSIRYSKLESGAWTASAAGSNVSAAPDWVAMAGCPTRDESIILTISSGRTARVFHHIGIYCYAATQLTASVGGTVGRPADVVYEPTTSDALVAYWIDSAGMVGWRTSSSGTLSGESQLTLPTATTVVYLRLVPVPGTDDIMLLALNSSGVLYSCLWSGAAWGSVTTISSTMSSATTECFAFAFETNSGDGLLVYSPGSTSDLKYRTYVGGSWSGEQTGPAIGNTYDWVRLAAKPTDSSNHILMGLLDHNKGVKAAEWNGASWGTLTTFTADAGVSDRRLMDVAYTPIGSQGIVAYAKMGQTRPYAKSWNGSSWSGEVQGPDGGEALRFVRLARGADSHEAQLVWTDDGSDLNATDWTGSALGSLTLIDGTVAGSGTTEPFAANLPSADASSLRRVIQWSEVNPN